MYICGQFFFVSRLEQAFYELSQSYYQSELRRVKSKKDYLNKDKVAHQVKNMVFRPLFWKSSGENGHK